MTNACKTTALGLALAYIGLAQPDRINRPIDRSHAVSLSGNTHPKAQPKFDRGPVDPSFQLSYVTMMLKQSEAQRAGLDELLAEQQNPASPNYRKWLTPEQYADRFGVSRNDIGKITAWLRSEGFSVESTARGRDWIAFTGTASQLEKAFHTTMHRYDIDGEMHAAISTEPSVPEALQPLIAALLGLDDFYPKALQHFRPTNTSSSGQITLAPADLATIYDLQRLYQAGINGQGQKIVIVGATSVDLADIQGFRSMYGLSNATVQVIQTGPDPGMNPPFLAEADLDLEWSGAMAPNATLIYVYSKDPGLGVFLAIDQNLAPVISESFVSCEQILPAALPPAYQTEAKKGNSMGITWLASAGDTGAAACDGALPFATLGLAVNLPASIPEITAVGGTEFNEGEGAENFWNATNNANGGSAVSYIPETAWNDTSFLGVLAATGGGVSTLFPKPAWQTGAGVPNDNARDLPDISMTASPPHDAYNVLSAGRWQLQGGTSAATPMFAGILALLNQYLLANPSPASASESLVGHASPAVGVGNINPTLYRLAQTIPAVFHDIVSGDNIVPCEAESPNCVNGHFGYSAGPGYDLVTGLGSVDGYNLVTGWNGIPAGTPSVTGLAPASIVAGGASFMLTVNGSNFAAGAQVQWNGTGLPTVVVSSTELQATVDSSLITSPGIVAISVTSGGKGSGVVYLTVKASASMALIFGNQRVTTPAPNACTIPTAMNSFVTTDTNVYLFFQATITANDRLMVSWLAPDGSVYNFPHPGLEPGTNYCGLSDSFNIGSLPASRLGAWQVRLYDNATLVFAIPFTVTLPGAATPTVASVVNGASFTVGAPVAPGSLATIFGTGFAPQIYASTIPLPTLLSGVSVIVNGRPAPLVFLNSTQINFEMPLETPAGTAKVMVQTNGVPSTSFTFQVQSVEPGLFVALNNADGTPNGPAHPASPGDFLVVYMTGQGPVSHPVFDGVPTPNPPPLFTATKPYSAMLGQSSANVTFLGLSPGFVGLAQADVQIPKLPPGTYPLVITVGGVASNRLTVSIK